MFASLRRSVIQWKSILFKIILILIYHVEYAIFLQEKEDILIYLVPELCSPTGLTDEMRGNFKLMKSVADITRVNPMARQTALREFIHGIKGNESLAILFLIQKFRQCKVWTTSTDEKLKVNKSNITCSQNSTRHDFCHLLG